MRPELRKDYLQNKYVLIAPKQKEHSYELEKPEPVNAMPSKVCKYCPAEVDSLHANLNLGSRKQWLVKVIDEKDAGFTLNNPKAYGKEEVVIETPNHIDEFDQLSEEQIAKVFEAYSHRVRELAKEKDLESILVIKNSGGRAGTSLQHSHSHIIATGLLPPELLDKSQKALAYKLEHKESVWAHILAEEKKSKRLIYKDEHLLAFAPYASLHNYEVWIMPFQQRDSVTDLLPEERMSMAKTLKHILKKISELHLPYSFSFDQILHDTDQHFCLKIIPRGNVWSGLKQASGLYVNPIEPEVAASYYRQDLK
jgi:UDPglucose--hexose-1-phosphate uridylyltransferase